MSLELPVGRFSGIFCPDVSNGVRCFPYICLITNERIAGKWIAPVVNEGLVGMPIARITGPGLAAIGVSVALLWGCVIAEGIMVRQALAERADVIRDIQLLRQR